MARKAQLSLRRFRLIWLAMALAIVASVPSGASPANDPPQGTSCEEPKFEATLDGYDQAEILVTTAAEKPQLLLVTLHYLESERCKPDGDLCLPFPCTQDPTCKTPGKNGLPVLRLASLPPVSNAGCPVAQPASSTLQFCIEATEDGNTAVIRFDRPNLLHSAGLLGLTYTTVDPDVPPACPESMSGPMDPYVKVFDKHRLSFDVGTLFTLNGDGSWGNDAEAAATFRSRWYQSFLSEVTFRRSAIGAVDDGSTEESAQESTSETAAESDPKDFNPLAEGVGLFEANVGAVVSPFWGKHAPRLGLALGAGFSSVQGGEGSKLETRGRYYVALRTEVEGWNAGRGRKTLAGASSWFQFGLAWDDLFQKVILEPATDTTPDVFGDESERYFLEGEVELPRVGTKWMRILVRAYASVPRSGDGPSDVRIAALASVDPREWFGGVGKPKP